MKLLALLGALAGSALTLGITAPAHAYCLTRTCDPATGGCAHQGTCVTSGNVLFWPNSCVSFDVQKDGSAKLHIDAATLDSVVNTAFAQWLNAKCPGGGSPSIRAFDSGFVDCAKPEYNKTQPNANVVTFHDSEWTYTNTADTVALTTVFFNGDTGEIYDANIEINSFDYDLVASNPIGTQLDLNAVLTHEVGHFLGLSHSDVDSATMFASYDPDMASLDPDDVKGICLSLPPSRSVVSSDCSPRHGFSGDCAKADTGCCATAVGSTPARGQVLGAFAFGLGLCAWTGRRLRLRRSRSALRR